MKVQQIFGSKKYYSLCSNIFKCYNMCDYVYRIQRHQSISRRLLKVGTFLSSRPFVWVATHIHMHIFTEQNLQRQLTGKNSDIQDFENVCAPCWEQIVLSIPFIAPPKNKFLDISSEQDPPYRARHIQFLTEKLLQYLSPKICTIKLETNRVRHIFFIFFF